MKALLELVAWMGLLVVAIKGGVCLLQPRTKPQVVPRANEGELFRDILAKKALETKEPPVIKIDPLEQANVFATYLRYDQAISVLRTAVETQPDRYDMWLKLLELYIMNKNGAMFDYSLSLLPDDLVFNHSEELIQLAEMRAKLPKAAPVVLESITPIMSDVPDSV